MKKTLFKKILTILITSTFLLSSAPTASAQILPRTTKSRIECEDRLKEKNWKMEFTSGTMKFEDRSDILGCAIKTGDINLWMVPFFITYLINFVLALAGLICVLFIVIGGYWYIIGSAQGQTDKGKNTIIYAAVGLIITLMAWIIINIVQSAFT